MTDQELFHDDFEPLVPSMSAADAPAKASKRGEILDRALEKISRGLMRGAFAPGQVLSIRSLAAALGTSPMPVREALKHLIASSVLEALPNRSARVPRLTEEDLRELNQVRIAIEGMAATAACANATPELIDRLSAINDRLVAAIAEGDLRLCLVANQAFHFTLYAASRSRFLMPLIEALWLRCGPTLYYSLLSPDTPWDASNHAVMLSALRENRPERMREAIERDINTTMFHVLQGPRFKDLSKNIQARLDEADMEI